MANKVHPLPPALINKIAAGEVIVRPASVVKELLENSIDAGARRIRIEIGNHCRDITVIDDGEGMTAEDARLALQRHTTSKISSYEDLNRLTTRGFRGEALASIAAVSRLEIIARSEEEMVGTRLKVEGGKLLLQEQIGAPRGVTINVRDLFFNTPARLKFLGTPRTELNQIIRLFVRHALSAPEIGFILLTDKKLYVELPPQQPLVERIVKLLGTSVADSLLPVDFAHPPLRVFGFIARPEHTRKDRSSEFFFVNRRPITSRSLSAAVEQAFKGYLMSQRYPLAVIFVEIDPQEVDVNVHPTKEEVRFTREYLVTGTVHRAVIEALRGANLTPNLKMPEIDQIAAAVQKQVGEQLAQTSVEKIPSFFSQQLAIIKKQAEERRAQQRTLPLTPFMEKSPSKSSVPSSSPPETSVTTPATPPEALPASPESIWKNTELQPVILGQIANTYILAELGEDLIIIDQHAAHERLLYEQLKNKSGQKIAIQPLMVPLNIEVGIADVHSLQKLCPLLQAHGIEIEHFGGQTFVVRSLPADIAERLDIEGMIFDLLDDLHQVKPPQDLTSLREQIIIRLACHSAVKSGQALALEEQRQLVAEIQRARLGVTCPHGRPTMILITRTQLDKQFKRK
ncbi:MAG: DNA mismatch repair endonuclease MutL [Candidatus Sumerlaeia bacterium]|nr:DNA mismatch repair endonuclease MutL [Candidatus Sumerlaeia bacterium]